jgi:D-lactate dehydrogenase (cytochrome)
VVSAPPSLSDFAAIVGREHVRSDDASRRYFARDIFFWPQAATPLAVVAPGSAAEVAAVVRAAADAGVGVASRGGGMSYSGGYVPHRDGCIVLDLRRLSRVREINVIDQYVTVEAGSTWMALTQALEPTGLRPVFRPPYSGIYSTVGGALSQGTADEMSGILGLEVALASGELLRTGSAARADDASPFFRNYGPDLAGPFIADGGRLGIKTAATIALEPRPRALGYASFAFESFEALMRGIVACSQQRIPGRMTGLDPRKSQNAPRVGFKDAIQTLAKVALTRPALGAGLRDALGMAAAGRNFMEGVQWSLHVTVEGVSDRAVEDGLEIHRVLALREGREIPNLLPMALAAKPYSVRGFLGPDGERWVPTNAMLPFSRAEAAATAVQRFFDAHREGMNALGLWESYMLGPRPGFVVLEPSFYWRDEISALHLDHLDAASATKFRDARPNPAARELAIELRDGLVRRLGELGAAHVQLAKAYAYRSRITPAAAGAWARVRAALDPQGVMNPGNLER